MRSAWGRRFCFLLFVLLLLGSSMNFFAQNSSFFDSEEKLFEVEREESSEGGEGGDVQSRDRGRGCDEEEFD